MWCLQSRSHHYFCFQASNERETIVRALRSFASSTCIRFTPLNGQRDFVDIQSRQGYEYHTCVHECIYTTCWHYGVWLVSFRCYSFVGRRGSGQTVSLSRRGCVFQQVIQHEMLHALGFDHEQTRSDRDQHVRILLRNVIRGRLLSRQPWPTIPKHFVRCLRSRVARACGGSRGTMAGVVGEGAGLLLQWLSREVTHLSDGCRQCRP